MEGKVKESENKGSKKKKDLPSNWQVAPGLAVETLAVGTFLYFFFFFSVCSRRSKRTRGRQQNNAIRAERTKRKEEDEERAWLLSSSSFILIFFLLLNWAQRASMIRQKRKREIATGLHILSEVDLLPNSVGAQSLTNHNDNTQRAAVCFFWVFFFSSRKKQIFEKESQNDGDTN